MVVRLIELTALLAADPVPPPSNRIVRHVLEVEPRPAASLGSSDITKIAIPHLGSHQPSNAGRLDVEVSHPNLGAILVFEVRKMWIHLDPNCPLRAGQPRQPPVAYASLFNLMLLGELNEEHPHIEMCGIANFPRIARDVLGNSHDDHGQPDFYQLFKNWVQRAFRTDPSGLNDVVLEILAWLRQESPELHKLHKDDWEKYVGLKLGDLIERQLKRIVELVRDRSQFLPRLSLTSSPRSCVESRRREVCEGGGITTSILRCDLLSRFLYTS